MSEDEGTNATAQGAPSGEHDDDAEPSEVDSATGADGSDADPDASGMDASETDDSETDDSSGDGAGEADSDAPDAGSTPDSGPETDVQRLLDRVTEYDDELARKVSLIVEEARNLNGTVKHQRAELEDLSERVDEQATTIEELQDELEARERRLEEYEDDVEDLKSRLKRKQADFQNYKKRAKKRQDQIKDRATEDLVERLLGVRDNLKRALEEGSDDVESLQDGVEMTLREFDRILEDENVSEIDPEPGTEADPQRHEVMMTVDSAQPEGTVAEVYTPGYEMSDKVIQNAQVTVSNGDLEEGTDDGTETADEDGTESSTPDDASADDRPDSAGGGDDAPADDQPDSADGSDDSNADGEGESDTDEPAAPDDASEEAIELGGEVANDDADE